MQQKSESAMIIFILCYKISKMLDFKRNYSKLIEISHIFFSHMTDNFVRNELIKLNISGNKRKYFNEIKGTISAIQTNFENL